MKYILVIEDDMALVTLIRQQFLVYHDEFIVTFAFSFDDAFEAIQRQTPDLVFVNPRIPQIQRLFPESLDTAQFPVIVMLDNEQQLWHEILPCSAMDYLLQSTISSHTMIWAARRTLREWDSIARMQRAERKLQQSEATFQTITESITQGFVLVRSDSTIQLVNQYVESVFGYQRDELVGQMIDVLLPEGYRHGHRHLREMYIQNPTPRAMGIGRDLLAQRKNGTTFPVEVSLAPVVISGEPCIMCIVVDITQRLKSQEDLRRSEERFRSLVNAMDDIIYTLDTEQRHTGVYGRWIENGSLTSEVFLGHTSSEILGNEASHIHVAANERALAGESVTYHWSNGTDDNIHYFQTRLSPMFDKHGQVTGIVGIGRDITELQLTKQQLEARVNERTTKLNRANQLLLEQVNERELSEVREREQRVLLESIHEIALAVNSSLDLNDILDRIVNTVHKVIPHDQRSIVLVNVAGFAEVVRVGGFVPELMKLIPQGEIDLQQGFLLPKLIRAERPVILDDVTKHASWHSSGREVLRSIIGTPLIADSKVLGFILLFSQQPNFFTQQDVERLGVFVNYAALAIRNAQLYEQAGELAVIKDRQRLARDLHDAVTQTLFSAGVVSDSLIRLWDTQPDKVKDRLIYLNQLTQGALAEMRTLLVELRPQAIAATDFDELARQLIISFYNRSGIQPTFVIECGELKSLASDAKEVLYRILQEALSNIIKHARATRVEINLECYEKLVQLEITDDGSGFDTSIMQSGTHLGLRIMQERAESINANFVIGSDKEKGTRIIVRWEG